jgi:hypothetical protein
MVKRGQSLNSEEFKRTNSFYVSLDSGPKVFAKPCDAIPVNPHENDDHQGEKNHSNLPILSEQLGEDFDENRTDDRSGKGP